MIDLSVAVPVYNEEDVLKELLLRLKSALEKMSISYEILLIDDGSKDKTREMVVDFAREDSHIKALFFSRNFGHQAAVSAALEHVLGEAVVVMDGDLQDPPEFISELYKKHKEGFDVVYAVRKKRKESFLKRFAYSSFYILLSHFSGPIKQPRDAGDFALMSRRVVDQMRSFREKNRYVRGLRSWVGFTQTGLEYERDKRYAGVTKYSFSKLFKLAYGGFFAHSGAPLFIVNFFGLLFALAAFVGILIILSLKLFTDKYIPGFASISILILFIGGVELLSVGVIGEYIRRIYDEVKDRPLFVVERKINFDSDGK